MNYRLCIIAIALALVAGLGCPNKKKQSTDEPTAEQPATAKQADEEPATNGAAAKEGETAQQVKGDLDALDPKKLTETAPDKFTAEFETTEGNFKVEVNREWSPNGADRFYNLVKAGYYTDIAVFRAIDGFMAQFGIHGDPAVNTVWKDASISDDPQVEEIGNKRGFVTFARQPRPDTRTVQLFINYGDNVGLDKPNPRTDEPQGFTPFGKVVGDGMEVVDKFHTGYGEGAPRGNGPNQAKLQTRGNEYLRESFPKLSYIKSVSIVSENGEPVGAPADEE